MKYAEGRLSLREEELKNLKVRRSVKNWKKNWGN
jgi:hypothetical protein